jgi:MFS family permease
VIDRIGYRTAMWFAFACHVVSVIVTVTAHGYWSLYVGTFIVALGNGTVEAAANPAIVSAYPNDKTRMLNRLHAGWPGGLVLGGLLVLLLGPEVGWRIKIALILLPTLVYGTLLLKQQFPVSERVTAGVSWNAMLAEVGVLGALLFSALTVAELGRVFDWSFGLRLALIAAMTLAYGFAARSPGRPLFLLLVLMMIPLATTELGTDSWITDLMGPQMQQLGLAPGWILVWTSLLMMMLRFFAGPFVHRLSPLGLLAAGTALAAVGLSLLSHAAGLAILAAATVYGIGKAFLWPTMLGVVAERFPRGGAMTLNTVAAVGMLSVGIVGAVFLGRMQDGSIAQAVQRHDAEQGTTLARDYLTDERKSVLGTYRALDAGKVDAALPADKAVLDELRAQAKQGALRAVAVLPAGLAVGFFLLTLFTRRRGGAAA